MNTIANMVGLAVFELLQKKNLFSKKSYKLQSAAKIDTRKKNQILPYACNVQYLLINTPRFTSSDTMVSMKPYNEHSPTCSSPFFLISQLSISFHAIAKEGD